MISSVIEQPQLPRIGQAVSALLDEHRSTLNQKLSRARHRVFAGRINMKGLAALLAMDRARLAGLLDDRTAEWKLYDIQGIADVLELSEPEQQGLKKLLTQTASHTARSAEAQQSEELLPLNLWSHDMPLRRDRHRVTAVNSETLDEQSELLIHMPSSLASQDLSQRWWA